MVTINLRESLKQPTQAQPDL